MTGRAAAPLPLMRQIISYRRHCPQEILYWLKNSSLANYLPRARPAITGFLVSRHEIVNDPEFGRLIAAQN